VGGKKGGDIKHKGVVFYFFKKTKKKNIGQESKHIPTRQYEFEENK
jgi:hypothetical protein